MSNDKNMSGVDVLAVMDRTQGALCYAGVHNSNSPERRELREARAAVAELVEADRDYDKAKAEYESAASRLEAWPALESAKARRAAALARVGGGK